MEIYRKLYRIVVEHDYFKGKPCSALQLRLAPQSVPLARQRNLLFKQIAMDAWELFFDSTSGWSDTKNDMLVLEISITDPNFALYTEWNGFRPTATHVLELPVAEETVDAASAICYSDEKRRVGTSFCTVNLRLTEELLEAAKAGKPKQALLRFRAPEVQWEYLFLSRGEDITSLGRLSLEDMTGNLSFPDFEKYEVYGRTGWRTISNERIPMRMAYESCIRLVAQNDGQRKRILLAQVNPPELGRFQSGQNGIIRQVSYY